MKLRLLILSIIVSGFIQSCEEDDENVNGTGTVGFSFTELIEVESATSSLTLNIGIDNFNHSGGTIDVLITGANYGSDYETSTGSESFTLEVAPQSLVANFTITPVDDQIIEEDKVLTIALTGTSGALELGESNTLTFTILDNDNPLVALVAFENETLNIEEDNTSNTLINIPFDQATTDGGTINISSSGDAVFGTDYSINGQTSGDFTLTVPGGATSASFEIQAIDNPDFATDKIAVFTLNDATGGLSLGATTQTSITIENDDLPANPIIDFSASNTLMYNEDAGTATLNFDISQATTADATIELTTSGTAAAADFNFGGSTANPYVFTIASGATTGSITLTIVEDSDIESDETIIVDISSVTGGLVIGTTLLSQTITITDNDATIFDYTETFESNDASLTYLNDVLNFQNVLATQTVDPTRVIGLITNAGSFSDVDNVNSSSDNGLNLFYNTGSDSSLNGIMDNVVITPVLTGSGPMNVSVDAAYAFRNQNSANITFYWSQTYDGSGGTFNEADWTIMGTETAADMFAEGLGNNAYKREEFTIDPTADFYIAIRVNQTVDDSNYRLRWRFDNFKVISQ